MTERTTWEDFKAEHPLTKEGRAAYEDEARISAFRDFVYRLRSEAGLTQAGSERHPRRPRHLGDVRPNPSPPHALVQGGRDDGMVVPDGLGGLLLYPHGTIKVIEMLGGQLTQPDTAEPGPDGLLDLGPVGPKRRRGEAHALALFQPLVEKLANRGTDTVAVGCLAFDEVAQGVVGLAGRATEGLRHPAVRTGDGVPAQGEAKLPYPFPQLALRATHGTILPPRCHICGMGCGMAPRAAEGPVPRDRP